MVTNERSAQPSPKETVVGFYEAVDRGTLWRFGGIAASFEARVFGAKVLDWPGFLAFGEAFREAFPDGRHVFDFVIADGDSVATIGCYRRRHTRPFMGVAATRRQVDFAFGPTGRRLPPASAATQSVVSSVENPRAAARSETASACLSRRSGPQTVVSASDHTAS